MKLILGNSLDKLKELEDNSVDSIVTDPPYGLSFMGKSWDYDVPQTELWKEVYRVLKPGGHLLSFFGTRTYHRGAVRIEDAGFEIRDQIMWVYGSGFPKSRNIGKDVDDILGNERDIIGEHKTKDFSHHSGSMMSKETTVNLSTQTTMITKTKGTSAWEGWGTALKPAHEPIVMARKPLSEKTVAQNVLEWGTGGLNIDECRVGTDLIQSVGTLGKRKFQIGKNNPVKVIGKHQGRFPANFCHDGSDEVVALFPNSKAGSFKGKGSKSGGIWAESTGKPAGMEYGDSGSAARFFYCAKASKSERNAGLEGFEEKQTKVSDLKGDRYLEDVNCADGKYQAAKAPNKNFHPTVKPISLMRYLCKLVTPKGGTVLDPFMGSGTTGIGAKLEGFDFIGIEREEEYIKIAEARINAWQKENKLL